MKSLIIGMVIFDFILHLYTWITSKHMIWMDSTVYDPFWTTYWGLILVFLIYDWYRQGAEK